MKKFLIILISICILFCIVSFYGCNYTTSSDCIRIHIRANSNDNVDQNIKLLVRDDVVNVLTPLLADCTTKKEAYSVMQSNLNFFQKIANKCLRKNGFDYTAKVSLKKESFPTRKYLSYTFPSGKYDALIIELGTGKGDNWWCVAFPPLCFIPDDADAENFQYKSKILEIIEKYKEVNNEKNVE